MPLKKHTPPPPLRTPRCLMFMIIVYLILKFKRRIKVAEPELISYAKRRLERKPLYFVLKCLVQF